MLSRSADSIMKGFRFLIKFHPISLVYASNYHLIKPELIEEYYIKLLQYMPLFISLIYFDCLISIRNC